MEQKSGHLTDHAATCASFSWLSVAAGLVGLPGGGIHMACEAVEHHLIEGQVVQGPGKL